MIRISKTFTRPSKTIPWFHETPAGAAWAALRQTMSEVLSNPANSISADGLTYSHSITWASREAFDARTADANYNAGIVGRKAYNAANGITESETQIVNL